ncbi:hypothetical protein D3C81_1727870 [compost metagenome]
MPGGFSVWVQRFAIVVTGLHIVCVPGCRYGVRIGAMPLSTCTGNAEVKVKFSAERPGTKAVNVPKWLSPM